jgi:hypothetical protein
MRAFPERLQPDLFLVDHLDQVLTVNDFFLDQQGDKRIESEVVLLRPLT